MPAIIKDNKVHFAHLGVHVAHACNLACQSCSHFSDHKIGGLVHDIEEQISSWSNVLCPREMVLAGGEPTLHPELPNIVLLLYKLFPESKIEIITNGLLIPKQGQKLFEACKITNARIKMSIHHHENSYLEKITPAKKLLQEWQQIGLDVVFTMSITRWTQRYIGYGNELKPFTDNDPESSYKICSHRYTNNELSYQIFQGKLWKCPPLAYLHLVKEKYNLSSEWEQYLKYAPLERTNDLNDIVNFLNREHENVCSMCPAFKRPINIPNPLRNKNV